MVIFQKFDGKTTTARPRETRFLVPEKDSAAQNRTSWGLYLCTEVNFFSKNSVTSRLQFISRLLLCSIVYSSACNFLANISFMRPRVSPIFWRDFMRPRDQYFHYLYQFCSIAYTFSSKMFYQEFLSYIPKYVKVGLFPIFFFLSFLFLLVWKICFKKTKALI